VHTVSNTTVFGTGKQVHKKVAFSGAAGVSTDLRIQFKFSIPTTPFSTPYQRAVRLRGFAR
ncbi:MAG TPA: hypothetical protein VEQ63_05635, partial [Bryobacteraceae bacterium]|nr:hypothetical protein [Bryobacteraceae bacterium]